MDEYQKLYEFITLAEKNRKYPANTAHGRRAALKLFETVLNPDERESLDLIEQRANEIYLTLISRHKDNFSIQSLNTYKGRFFKIIQDYKRYGANPDDIMRWEVKQRSYTLKDTKIDENKDVSADAPSLPIHKGVHKLQIALENGQECLIQIPVKISNQDTTTIKKIIDSLAG